MPTRLLLATLLWFWSSAALAQAWSDPAPSVLVLARVAHHEAGSSAEDVEAIRESLLALAVHVQRPFDEVAQSYATRALDGTGSRPWVAQLDLVCSPAPANFPALARWDRELVRWARTVEHAERAWNDKIPSPCRGTVHDWGHTRNVVRLLSVECPGTLNEFWARPLLRRLEASGARPVLAVRL